MSRTSLALSLSLAFLLLLMAFAGLMTGFAPIGPGAVLQGLLSDPDTDKMALIVQDIRAPRLIVGMLVGAALGMSGAALQGLLRNPLADPGVIGVSASAGLGAVLAIYYGAAAITVYAIPGFAMLAALVSTLLLYALARRDTSVLTLILVGVGIASLAGALTSLAMNLSPNPFSLAEMVLWLLGSLANRSHTDVLLAGPFVALGLGCLLAAARPLRALTLGEETAASIGVNLVRTRILVILGTSLSVGAGVSVTGSIGFVGLIVPHMLRPFVGADPARLLIPSALGGAILITVADLFIRLIPTDQELKLGVLTAILGAPVFLALVIRTRRSMR
ncbi:MAG: FecCD family ABC transporter permease [Alphaproteobacteria bacterium]